jgi:hypothetical protein
MNKGLVLSDLINPPKIKNKRNTNIVLKTCLQSTSGIWHVIPCTIPHPQLTYILIRLNYLSNFVGPDIIATVGTDGRISTIYGGEWNGGTY